MLIPCECLRLIKKKEKEKKNFLSCPVVFTMLAVYSEKCWHLGSIIEYKRHKNGNIFKGDSLTVIFYNVYNDISNLNVITDNQNFGGNKKYSKLSCCTTEPNANF